MSNMDAFWNAQRAQSNAGLEAAGHRLGAGVGSPKEPALLSGSCYCGAVTVKALTPPFASGMCHCIDCRKWGGGMGQIATLFHDNEVEITGELVGYANEWVEGKMGAGPDNFSMRKSCAKCFGCVVNDHAGMGARDVCGGILDAKFDIHMHLNYPGNYCVHDGKPKFKDFPPAFGGTGNTLAEGDETFADAPELAEGSCYCGAVTVKVTAPPAVTAICHCVDCRKWGGGVGQLANLFKDEDIAIEGELVAFANPYTEGKMGAGPDNFSSRKCCAKCFSCVVNDHASMGKRDVCGGVFDNKFSPAMHINYDSRLMDVKDGLPKFKDVPAGFGGTDEKLDESEW